MMTKCTAEPYSASWTIENADVTFLVVRDFADRVKRILVGRPVPSQALGETLLPKRIALPVFASDALSSVGYAPDEVLVTLAVAGFAATALSPTPTC